MNAAHQERQTLAIVIALMVGLLAGLYLGTFYHRRLGTSRADWPQERVQNPRNLGP